MTVSEVYNSLGIYLSNIVKGQDWERAELYIEVQPGYMSLSGKRFVDKESLSLRTKINDEISSKIQFLHDITTEGGSNKWNKANFIMFPNDTFEMEFVWDKEWQEEVDRNNKQAEAEDHNYKAPKWKWEE